MESNIEIAGIKDSGRYFLDITADVCPLTFVKAKLLLERMPKGAIAEIRLGGAEPLENVPRALAEDGHEVMSLAPEDGTSAVHRLVVRKG
ncbi:MAG TPA: sulfurtransferase TusA family protein [Alphaproteobacteria bacterium]|nr:sulfurtransferase TusA family protein [Alphaproteobacteria bacterium]